MAARTKKQQDKRKIMVRILCVFLCILMVFSLVAALFGVF